MTRKPHSDLRQMPVQEKPCKTCPFAGEQPIELSDDRYRELLLNLMGYGQHFCHSAHDEKICRGGRNIQLQIFHRMGWLDEPTDEAFNQAVDEAMMNNE